MSGYSAVVLGGALYYFHLLGEARKFLGKHRKALGEMPVAVFGMGPIEDTPEQYAGAREMLDKALAKYEWLDPVSVTVFGGKLDPAALRFPDNNPAMKGIAAVDLRDWDAIGQWAREVAGELRG
jgi:menaquinone-dependent protoporphyrinogen oxidase